LTTVISVSGSTIQPGWNRAVFAAIASRSGLAPKVIAYWLWSAATASAAAVFSSGGQGKSGEALGQADGAGRDREPVHLADDRFGEALRLVADPSHGASVGGRSPDILRA
jgi:hypothetical protein